VKHEAASQPSSTAFAFLARAFHVLAYVMVCEDGQTPSAGQTALQQLSSCGRPDYARPGCAQVLPTVSQAELGKRATTVLKARVRRCTELLAEKGFLVAYDLRRMLQARRRSALRPRRPAGTRKRHQATLP
jgi:hypothetical protein